MKTGLFFWFFIPPTFTRVQLHQSKFFLLFFIFLGGKLGDTGQISPPPPRQKHTWGSIYSVRLRWRDGRIVKKEDESGVPALFYSPPPPPKTGKIHPIPLPPPLEKYFLPQVFSLVVVHNHSIPETLGITAEGRERGKKWIYLLICANYTGREGRKTHLARSYLYPSEEGGSFRKGRRRRRWVVSALSGMEFAYW